jgi:hypothetical protein
MRKTMKPGRKYFIINIDEPYAPEIYEVLKRGQMEKGEWPEGNIDFEEWTRQTFGCALPQTEELDWEKAEEHLSLCEKAYAKIGSPGYLVLNVVIRPLRNRLNGGERTRTLYHAIMGVEL